MIMFAMVVSASMLSQSMATASRVGDLQIGASLDLGKSDYYETGALKGFGFYTTFDIRRHLGIEADFHQIGKSNSQQGVYERSYEIGPRYVLHLRRLSPYAKLMVGRGVFNFPPFAGRPNEGPAANLAFTTWTGGFGADYEVRRHVNIRGDYELQQWKSFPLGGLSPHIFSFGAAYHFR